MDTVLPVQELGLHRRQPWLLHMLAVNTLNFCSFACCEDTAPDPARDQSRAGSGETLPILVAVPSARDSDGVSRRFHWSVPAPGASMCRAASKHAPKISLLTRMQIDVFQLPHEARVHAIPAESAVKTGETRP